MSLLLASFKLQQCRPLEHATARTSQPRLQETWAQSEAVWGEPCVSQEEPSLPLDPMPSLVPAAAAQGRRLYGFRLPSICSSSGQENYLSFLFGLRQEDTKSQRQWRQVTWVREFEKDMRSRLGVFNMDCESRASLLLLRSKGRTGGESETTVPWKSQESDRLRPACLRCNHLRHS